MRRRDFLTDLARLAALAAVVPNDWRVVLRPRWADDPFTLGVAAGDPTASSAMIWTRLATRPLEPEGGMAGDRIAVQWEVAADERFARVTRRGRATAAPELGYSVHVDVEGLDPERWYFYRFLASDATSAVGRLRTTPRAADVRALRFAFASCQHWETGFYTAYEHMAREELDLVAHLGDYIYEYGPAAGRARVHNSPEVRTLADYRGRYALYKSDPALQAAHARCPWVVTWDDHEVDNNYAGAVGENVMESEEQMLQRRAAAYQAWWEHQPARVARVRSWADLSIVRTVTWGATANVWMLDSRQYRSDQACGDGGRRVPCGDWADPARTLLGERQERWLAQGLASSGARWEVLANQTMVGHFDPMPGPEVGAHMDNWSGYPAARTRLLRALEQHAPLRSVVITGDIHANWVNELRADPGGRMLGAEFVGTSISSGGDGSDRSAFVTDAALAENTHVHWQNNRRGYVVCEITPDAWRTAFRTVPFVSRPGAPVETPATWRLSRGRAGIEREA